MPNIPELISKMATGNGVFKGDAVFALADGSFVDKDGKEVAAASTIGASAYSNFEGFSVPSEVTSEVTAAVTAHNASATAHATEISGAISTHNTDAGAHYGLFNDSSANLKQNATTFSMARSAMVSFIDDDGGDGVYTRLFPLLSAKNVIGNLAIISGLIGTDAAHITEPQLAEICAAGWETLGHTVDHYPNLLNYPDDDDLEYQIEGCKNWLVSRGYKMNGFVYPQSASDVRVRRFVKKHSDFAFGGVGINSGDYIDSMMVNRINFGSWTENNPTINGNSEKNTIAYYKACVDYAITNSAWLVFVTHIGSQSLDQDVVLGELIDYILLNNVDVVSASYGFSAFGNKLFVGDMSETWVAINDRGMFYSGMQALHLNTDAKSPESALATYKKRSVTFMPVSNAFATTYALPETSGGTLATYYVMEDDTAKAYNRQEYLIAASDRKYTRNCDASGVWGAWILNVYSAYGAVDSIAISNTGSAYKKNSITITPYSDAYATANALPTGGSGICYTYKFDGVLLRQEYFPNYSAVAFEKYIRYYSSGWSAWMFQEHYVLSAFNSFTNAQLITAYPTNRITTFCVGGAGASGFPGSGVCTTYRMTGNGWDRQEFRKYDTDEVWARHTNASDGAWSTWVKISAV